MPFPNISWQPFEERYFGEKILQQKPLIAPSRSCVGGESNGRHTLGPKGALVILGIVAEYSLHLSEYFFPLEYVSEREIKEQEWMANWALKFKEVTDQGRLGSNEILREFAQPLVLLLVVVVCAELLKTDGWDETWKKAPFDPNWILVTLRRATTREPPTRQGQK